MTNAHADRFLRSIYQLDARRNVRRALDKVFAEFDQLHQSGKFADADKLLARANVAKLSTTLIVGFLSVTLPAKPELAERAAFWDRAAAATQTARSADEWIALLAKYK